MKDTSAAASNPVGTEQCVTATVQDAAHQGAGSLAKNPARR